MFYLVDLHVYYNIHSFIDEWKMTVNVLSFILVCEAVERAHDERHRNDKHKRRRNKSQDGDDEKRIDKKKENNEQHEREGKKKVLEEAKNDENRAKEKRIYFDKIWYVIPYIK